MTDIPDAASADAPRPAGLEPLGLWERTRMVWRRLPFARRPIFAWFPVMAVLLVIAIAFGMQLGESAIAQIDPVHFQGPAPKARDVSQDPSRVQPDAYSSAYSWEQGYSARAADCGDCPAFAARSPYAPVPSEAYSDPTIEPAWEQASSRLPDRPSQRAEQVPAEDSVEWQRVRRYVYYPVSGDPDVTIPTRADERPAPVVQGETEGM